MIPGIVAYGGILAPSAPASFKGVATLGNGGVLEVWQDNGSSWTNVFSLTDSSFIDVQLGAVDLLVRSTTIPYIRVYSWDGTTFTQTASLGISGGSPGASCFSYDGNRVAYNSAQNHQIYVRSNGSYSTREANVTGITPPSNCMNFDGTSYFTTAGTNNTAYKLSYLSGAWQTSFTSVSGTNYGTHQAAHSRVATGLYYYATTMSTSSPYVQIYRCTVSSGAWVRLTNVTTLPPSTWTLKSCDVAYDGSAVVIGYQAGATANGGVRIYAQSSVSAFNNITLDTGAILDGNVAGVSFNSTYDKLYVARASATAGVDKVWVWTRSGSTWTQTGYVPASTSFNPSSTTYRVISAN